ncbi:MAG: hypothetical protein ABSF46_08610 [Terriglobia bacterium]|jgi:hypothetical protein
MSVKLTNSIITGGSLGEGLSFGPACKPGDWQELTVRINWPQNQLLPRVFVTPYLDDTFPQGAAPVCVVAGVGLDSFTLAARNATRSQGGSTAFSWLAMREPVPSNVDVELDIHGTPMVAGTYVNEPVLPLATLPVPDLSMGVVPPLSFAPAGAFGDLQTWPTPGVPDPNQSSVLMAPTNLNVTVNNVAAVGLVNRAHIADPFLLTARNSDCASGACAFYWAAFSHSNLFNPQAKPEPSIETGEVNTLSFPPSGQTGDWQFVDIYFADPFLNAPVVLLTAHSAISSTRAAVVGIARDVTPYGFRLAMRNSDCGAGVAGFYWAAIGMPIK